MWVYGDRVREADPRAEIAALERRLAALDAPGLPIERHARLVTLFILASELAQGLADTAMERNGGDGRTPEGEAAAALLMALADELLASWRALRPFPSAGGGKEGNPPPSTQRSGEAPLATYRDTSPARRGGGAPQALQDLAALDLPDRVRLKTGEGYAFYALYPEAYAEAARGLSAGADATVIGVRSIGLGLAAIAASALRTRAPVSVRPVGHPFQRELDLRPELEGEFAASADGSFVVVDEGPGLSGSSFGAVADALERLGAARSRIAFLPGHGGDLGREASDERRTRWRDAERPTVDMDALLLDPQRGGHPLPRWFDDLAGGEARWRDLSGGAWRPLRFGEEAGWPAADAFQERRKLLLEGVSGRWLLKFSGLGEAGDRAFDAARSLGEAGWSPPAAALRYGFMATEWLDAAPLVVTDAFVEHLGRYLAWRATRLAAPSQGGATLPELREMLRTNAAEALGDGAIADAAALDPARWNDAPPLRRVWTDNRLHAPEWLALPGGGWLKTDAVDHAAAHDLVGAQDLAWDLAGAAAEFDLDPARAARLLAVVREQAPVEPELVQLFQPAYLAFQLGLWTLAADAHTRWPREAERLRRQADRYRRRLAARLLQAP